MSIGDQILISLEARHAENIMLGRKLVEFRRRPMNVKPGATIWIYAKLPVGSIVGYASVTAVHMHARQPYGGISGLFLAFREMNSSTISKGFLKELRLN